MDDEDSTSYERLVAFVESLGVMQRVGRGCLLFDKEGNSLVDNVLIGVKELLECKTVEDIRAYLGSYFVILHSLDHLRSSSLLY